MHTIDEIKHNQKEFRFEIVDFLKKDLKRTKESLYEIKSDSKEISDLQEKLKKKLKNFKLIPEIEKYFLSSDNPSPKYYALWEDELKEVKLYKFDNEERKKEY